MRRREFIGLLGAVSAWPLAACAQQVPVVGYLHTQSVRSVEAATAAFSRGLAEAGFLGAQTILLEYRYADGQPGRLPALAADLVERKVSVIAAMGGSQAVVAAKAATTTIPIVFTRGDADPAAAGIVSSLARPQGNVMGISLLGGSLGAKRLELLREVVPAARTIGILINPENRAVGNELQELQSAIVAAGQKPLIVHSGAADNLETAVPTLVRERADALVVAADPIFTNRRTQLAKLASDHRIPTIYQWSLFMAAGGLMSYGTDIPEVYRQAGAYTARVLKGTKPADLPVLQPTKFELVINLKAARAIGLDIPATLLAGADDVLE